MYPVHFEGTVYLQKACVLCYTVRKSSDRIPNTMIKTQIFAMFKYLDAYPFDQGASKEVP